MLIRRTYIITVFLILVVCKCNLFAQSNEYLLKAAYLEKFALFTDWPTDIHESHFIIGIIGDNPFGDQIFEYYDNLKIKNKDVKIELYNSVKDIKECNVLFIENSKEESIKQILKVISDKPILTIGDTEGFAEDGVILNLYLDGNKIKFEINEDAVKKSGLNMSYHLLKLARSVSSKDNKNG